jgi:uncharacterized protein
VRPLLFAAMVLTLLATVVLLLLRGLHPEWWRLAGVRRALAGVVGLGGLGIPGLLFWSSASGLSIFCAFVLLALVATLPVSGLFAGAIRLATRGVDPGRRALFLHATAALPGAAILACVRGGVGAFAEPLVRRVSIPVPRLPAALEGLRIFQLTDPHLGRFFGLATLERVLERVARERPDLALLTGDIADDPALIRPALAMVRALGPRLGVYASLGNHEYYLPGGALQAKREFERAEVPLLVDEGVRLRTAGETILLGGVNDPARMGVEMARFLEDSVRRATRERGADDFVVLLSHRPDGFGAAKRAGAGLTLSGHTHGGQIGWHGRSVFAGLFPAWYLRGLYRHGSSTLYTSTGFGHWLPMRIDCPAEAPILVLTSRIGA